MPEPVPPVSEDVEHLLLNARLRDELEPFLDESIERLNLFDVPTPIENELLASMLAWERAPILPIADWFAPPLRLPHPHALTDGELQALLHDAIEQLYAKRVVLDFTEHLSDRQLYQLIYRDILTSPEKQIDRADNYLHWDCSNAADNPELYLRYYATAEERRMWEAANYEPPPPSETPPYPRDIPHEAL